MPRRKPIPDIGSACRAHAQTMLNVLRGIACAEDSPESARIQAATAILAYGYGKPKATIEAKGITNQTLIINGGDTRDIARRLIYAMASDDSANEIKDITPHDSE